jgi:hypothetical protein
MSVTLIPSSLGFVWGLPSAETGMNVDKFTLTVEPEIDEYLAGPDGEAICNAVGDPKGELAITGEIKAYTGIVASTFIAAQTFANDLTTSYKNFGRTQGGFYLKKGEKDLSRGTWNKVDLNFASRWNIP